MMAQQTQTPGGQKKSSGAAPPASGGSNGFLGGLRAFFSPAPPANGSKTSSTTRGSAATPARPTLNLRKVILGFLLLLVGVYAIQFLLLFLDIQLFKGALQRTTVLPSNVPLLGGLTLYSLLAIGLMIALWVVLLRYDLLPRANRAQAQASAAATPASSRIRARDRIGPWH
jgi:hypothetical protein